MNAIVCLNLNIEPREFSSSLRLEKATESLKTLLPKFERIVILSYRGRPAGKDKKLSLKPVIEKLSFGVRRKIIFLDGNPESHIEGIIQKKGLFALENTRFLSGETKNSESLAQTFASFGDIFINDDFATCHRVQASNVGITKFLTALEGPIMKLELSALKKVTNQPAKPLTLIIGGEKISTKLSVIKNLLPKADYVLLGGGPGNMALKASGHDIGKSIYEKALLAETKRLISNKKVIYPIDSRISEKAILDIGPNTISKFSEIINSSGTVIWAGPMGMFERKAFSAGTKSIAEAIAKSSCFSLAGGGGTTSAIISYGLKNKFSFLSTGGGAMLEFLSGKKLPALEALRIKYR
jgi:phosphoglycerate kinase